MCTVRTKYSPMPKYRWQNWNDYISMSLVPYKLVSRLPPLSYFGWTFHLNCNCHCNNNENGKINKNEKKNTIWTEINVAHIFVILDTPKSAIFKRSLSQIKMLHGFRSLCTTFFMCKYSMPWTMSMTNCLIFLSEKKNGKKIK